MNKNPIKNTCKQCATDFDGHYCSNCGLEYNLRKIDFSYLLTEVVTVLNFNKGIFYTIREIVLRPGKSVQHYLYINRNLLVKPVLFIVLCSLFYSIVVQVLNIEDGYINYTDQDWNTSTTGKLFAWISNNYGYTNVLITIFIAAWLRLFFRKSNNNFYEIIVLLCYSMGIAMLIYALFGILESITTLPLLQFGVYIALLHSTWSIGQFFKGKKIWNYLKAILSYSLGFLSFVTIVLLIGIAFDKVFDFLQ